MSSLSRYEVYINSDAWRRRRIRALQLAGYRCQLCSQRQNLDVHHNNYENLGNERDEDLVVLCGRCHRVYHVRLDRRTSPRLSELKRLVPKRINALPAPPEKPKIQRNVSPHPVKDDRNGSICQIVVTKQYVEDLVSSQGGITYRGLRLLGESIPWQKGWRHRSIGRTVVVDEGELLAELQLIRNKRPQLS